MTPDLIIVLAACATAPAGLLWQEWHRRIDAKREERGRCDHVGEGPKPVAGSRFDFVEHCVRGCGAQRHVDKDGIPRGDWR